jgi:hypothetical protein
MQEVLLDYNEMLGWHAYTETLRICMTDATFQRHVDAYLLSLGITQPTLEQKIEARQRLRRLSFWESCSDPEVYKRRLDRYRAARKGVSHYD